MKIISFLTVMVSFIALMTQQSLAASDREIIRGFNLTVFGAEFAPFGVQSHYIRKFVGPVRIKIHNFSGANRVSTINRFVKSLNRSINGLKVSTTKNGAFANFNVYVVDRIDYVKIARQKIYKRKSAKIPGKCLVRSVFSRAGIIRSDAIVVSDGGEHLFQRCMIEEILQGLGPLNESTTLSESMFNDQSKHTKFTQFDRTILNMLYDRRIKNGASIEKVQKILPSVLADVKLRTR